MTDIPNYYQCHQTKQFYKVTVIEALEWLQKDSKNEIVASAARKFRVQQNTLQQAICRQNHQARNFRGFYDKNEGKNSNLSIPSSRWFCNWLKNNPDLHTIKTKPIATERLNTHTEKDYKACFKEYAQTLEQYQITSGKQVMNMDESGVRIVTIIETIIADGREPPPPYFIVSRSNFMDCWASDNLTGKELVDTSPSGYTNNWIARDYLDHLIEHVRAGPNKRWGILLLDSYETHDIDEFKLKALENHIKPFYFPSHSTHALQPFDVCVFQPLQREYKITQFFDNLVEVRTKTMKKHTIVNAFQTTGTWPLSQKKRLAKLRSYKPPNLELPDGEDNALPQNLHSRYNDPWDTATAVGVLADCDPTQFSVSDVQFYKTTLQKAGVELQKAHLTSCNYANLQQSVLSVQQKRVRTQKSSDKGGSSTTVDELREKIAAKESGYLITKIRNSEKQLSVAKNKGMNC
ncbi:hypothetical protein K3495_g3283 [Podosphaera aphanis]|nr:hypothetical protein K3495_g3283 [Podosphaera aphanis]